MAESANLVGIPVKGGYIFVDEVEIIYIEARHNYCCIYLKGKGNSHLVQVNIDSVLEVLKSPAFCRIHRSYVVRVGVITFMNTRKTRVTIPGDNNLPVGRTYLPGLLEKVRLMKL